MHLFTSLLILNTLSLFPVQVRKSASPHCFANPPRDTNSVPASELKPRKAELEFFGGKSYHVDVNFLLSRIIFGSQFLTGLRVHAKVSSNDTICE